MSFINLIEHVDEFYQFSRAGTQSLTIRQGPLMSFINPSVSVDELYQYGHVCG